MISYYYFIASSITRLKKLVSELKAKIALYKANAKKKRPKYEDEDECAPIDLHFNKHPPSTRMIKPTITNSGSVSEVTTSDLTNHNENEQILASSDAPENKVKVESVVVDTLLGDDALP